MQAPPLNIIREYTTQYLLSTMIRDNIGSEFMINDNLDHPIDFDSPEMKKIYQGHSNKIVGHCSIFICLEGEVELMVNTQDCVMKAGDVSFAQSGHLGTMKRFSPDCKFLLVICSDEFYMPPLTANESAAFRRELVSHPIAHLSDSYLYGITIIYQMIANALAKRDELHYVRRTVQGLFQSMFFMVLSSYATQASETSPYTNVRQEEIFNRFIKLVQKNYATERGIAFYADKLCITPKYLSQLIYKASGMYAGDHIDNYVIGEAKLLIKSRKYSIAQISDMLNFTSQAYFGRYFKKHTGYTPLEFAEKG